ncbi:hypothetical protein HCB17_17230 [Salinispora arenicola]|uniref:hypothetical protein n=1 Tax=Salinispora arenicola TaxID=168697 RepID=UPI0003789023|nr:hypothetical protein [Salinispora arenicola]NIL42698.1 hypothetical protein [Salinispora arenicola]
MNSPAGRLWVDPEGVVLVGDGYAEHAALYQNYLNELDSLRSRYAGSWGNDEMGVQFSQAFLGGMDNIEGVIGGVKGRLAFAGEGLRENGRLYRVVDDEAQEVSHSMRQDFDSHLSLAYAEEGVPGSGEGFAEPLLPSVVVRATRPEEGVPGSEEGFAEPPLQPVFARATNPETSVSLASSPYMVVPDDLSILVDGEPLPEGSRLVAFRPFPEGDVRVDVNLYDSITPVDDAPITDGDGQVLDPGGGRFFVVVENPDVDPTEPDYQPLVLSYTDDWYSLDR